MPPAPPAYGTRSSQSNLAAMACPQLARLYGGRIFLLPPRSTCVVPRFSKFGRRADSTRQPIAPAATVQTLSQNFYPEICTRKKSGLKTLLSQNILAMLNQLNTSTTCAKRGPRHHTFEPCHVSRSTQPAVLCGTPQSANVLLIESKMIRCETALLGTILRPEYLRVHNWMKNILR